MDRTSSSKEINYKKDQGAKEDTPVYNPAVLEGARSFLSKVVPLAPQGQSPRYPSVISRDTSTHQTTFFCGSIFFPSML